jgi:hypothetical protein
MSEEARQESGGQTSSSSMVLVIVLWAMVLIPLAWGVYQTLTGVVALFAGGIACRACLAPDFSTALSSRFRHRR